ncbi:ABC transporter ATP-binding protein [Peptostreptococcus anaerobius]|uniref:ABC transporter, ATP-binding protein n=1 Tax=Peptostreptococcus anaerobius 653-L TaxID=596329 RepID=D3MQK3_9FIRM|nr:ABC transporter ATP-binding protein [Peptostreptococcus anaerobius]EFD05584.1 ABC transporter, ATP-binding protein [Peptostreptococcus anaerobius 653-L]MDK8278560.1 ABC transporter ATP-binding protein [Peptostreptococcus anaerobius]MDU1599315.1 ABC transporter ATP-binding protein [Peptostreptococcus anaerobius]MDU1682891.1 ABC transporter ATP-binding protein [Peptostreptococcus anaerobius]MDU5567177.1 ABC transporter ATP-binding protein [Peptostreptococcus anaerobius]
MSNLKLIKIAMPYFKRYKSILFIDLLCAGLTTASEMVLPLILRYMTNLGIQDKNLLTMGLVARLAILFIVIKLVELVAVYYMASIGHIMGAKIETDMRSDVYKHLQTLSDRFYNETKVGQIMSRMTNDLFDITEFAHHCPEEYFIGFIKIIVSLVILLNINVPLTIAIYILIPFMFICSSKFKNRMRDAQIKQRAHIGNLNSSIEDSLLGIKVVKSFANEDVEREKFTKENNKFLSIKALFYKSMAGFNTINRAVDGVMYFVLVVFGGVQIINGNLEPGDMLVYIMYVSTLLVTVKRIIEFTEQFQKGMTGIERFSEIMETRPDIVDKPNAIELKKAKGHIEFRDVDFKYSKHQEDYILEKFNLDIEAGKNVALVGPSGSGKTTVCTLIPRFYDVVGGQILVDGTNVKDFTMNSLRNNIGIVQQDVYLFSGTVYDNILYGKPDATREEVEEAARLAGAYDFIMDLENGFDTYVGERGVMLSGGQKQRVSIARVFLKNPPILILDEATSALDNNSEAIVQESLEILSKGRTTITIAHRLTTIQNADTIVVMNEDGIVEKGSHEELMSRKGYYYELYTRAGNSNRLYEDQ